MDQPPIDKPHGSTVSPLWRRIRTLVRPYTPRVLAAVVFSLVVSGLDGAIAWLVKPAMDQIFVEQRYEFIMYLPIGVMALYILRGGADFLQAYYMRTAGYRLVRDLRNQFFESLAHLPISVAAKSTSGEMVSRVMNDIGLLSNILSESFRTFLVQIPSLFVLTGVALYRRWDLALLSFLLLPFIAYGTRTLSVFVRRRRKRVQHFMALLTHRMHEMFTGLRVVKIFGMEGAKIAQFRRENQTSYRQTAKVILLREGANYLTDILSGLSIAIILGYGGHLVAKGDMTSGDFFSVLAAIVMAFNPLKKLGGAYTSFQESLGVLERVDDVLTTVPETSEGTPVQGLRKGIRFMSVAFAYPGSEQPVLKDINLFVPSGKVVAIVGPSGAGKSTLVDLVPRFLTPTAGRILWDDQDLAVLQLKSLRANIGMVNQDVILFSDTVRENIASGRPEVPIEDIVAAAQVAQAHEFIMALPQGYDTILDERGLNLSGGQRQRIALARAVLKNPPLLILDEATSALDTVSEQAVQEALASMMLDRTTIVIAHRLSTIHNADQLVVLDQGRIIATGSHAELLDSVSLYRELYHSWNSQEI